LVKKTNFCAVFCPHTGYDLKMNSKNKVNGMSPDVQLKQFPYPYRSMLAIRSDLYETPDKQVYMEMMRFLNTTETTAIVRLLSRIPSPDTAKRGQNISVQQGSSVTCHLIFYK